MAVEPEKIRIRAQQHSASVRIYHTQYLLAQGSTDILESVTDLEQAHNLTDLGRSAVSQLLTQPGVAQVLVYNYQVLVEKRPEVLWADYAGITGADRITLVVLGRIIATSMLQHRSAVAELAGENPADLPELELDLGIEGLPPGDAPHQLPVRPPQPNEGEAQAA